MPVEQAKLVYLEGLKANLLAIRVDDFRALVAKLGGDFNKLAGTTDAEKADAWVRQLDQMQLLDDLAQHGLVAFPARQWNFLATQPCRYYIASSRLPVDRGTVFSIRTNRFVPARTPNEADVLIFDLDCPPENWLEYLGAQPHVAKSSSADYRTTLFAQFSPVASPPNVKLTGSHLSALLQSMNIVNPAGICRTQSDLMRSMLAVGQFVQSQWPGALNEALNRQAMANVSTAAAPGVASRS